MTPKQELFAQAYLETSNASEAYKRAYNTQANANTVNRKASQLLKHPEVSTHIIELQNEQRKKHHLTLDDILQELEQTRLLALKNKQCSAAISATMSKAKLLGLDKKAGTNTDPLTALIASIQGSSVQVVQHCDDD
ncbi:terminase small subunit [uncultured Agitococcus sp.]|uniref:terminase small subunit n=1 Tax=uncultured Agitococcus sp. TaxID=1506599 RepID=UPI002629B31C|nr:terminase small subunit [uncultured Agitococcus sp.]